MKKLNLVFLTLLPLLFAQASAAGCMADIKKNGLTVGTSPDYPPYESLDKNNQIVGYDIDLVRAIGNKMGVKVNVVGQSFDGLIPALLAKKIDMIASGMSITEERKKSVNFSLPYVNTQNVILARKENVRLGSAASLNGKSVGVQLGSVQETLAQGIKGANVKSYNLSTDTIIALQSRQIDAMIVARAVSDNILKTYPDLRLTGVLNKVESGFAIRKDCNDLTNRVNAALIELRKSGEVDKLSKKWLK